jgi:hypothetical protein
MFFRFANAVYQKGTVSSLRYICEYVLGLDEVGDIAADDLVAGHPVIPVPMNGRDLVRKWTAVLGDGHFVSGRFCKKC